MNEPILYIFDPESPSEDFIEIELEKNSGEYVVEDYVFLAGETCGVSVSFRVNVDDLKFFIAIKEDGKQRVGFSGKKMSVESSDPVIVYTSDSGDSYQFTIKI